MPRMPNRIKLYLAVGIGGMLGALGRYMVSVLFTSAYLFPFGTLLANLIGCFFLSYLLHNAFIKSRLSTIVFTGLSTGLIGAFTTFSTFAVETIQLVYQSYLLAITYVLCSVGGGLLCCYIGYRVAHVKR